MVECNAVSGGVQNVEAHKVENIKKIHNLKTYKEILAFQEGRQLTDEEKGEGRKKNKYKGYGGYVIWFNCRNINVLKFSFL
jgi:hypothetical protein